MYDFLVVGAGLTGATITRELTDAGMRCLVIEKRAHVGGNIYTEMVEGIQLHRYGPHIFHTNNKEIWDYLNRFVHMNRYTNCPIANYHGKLYNLPFNMNTFYQIWGVQTPQQAIEKIQEQRQLAGNQPPRNLEEQAIHLVGTDIYETLIKGYTQKQWGRPCSELPPEIILRLPIRFTFDNNYFDASYQGIPEEGYTVLVEKLLYGADVWLNTDYLTDNKALNSLANTIIYTGCIDQYYSYRYGPLAYRSVRFETERLSIPNFQGNAVINYTDAETPYTRIIEHKHFNFGKQPHTIISKEYSSEWHPGVEPYYPINNDENQSLYKKYAALAQQESRVHFLGRLAQYCYLDMDRAMENALVAAKSILNKVQ